ncbi:MAG: alanine racemase [Ruminococcaceae bacterium]|nr:alanine racemase [Oscillospiraceae bacterium]
MFKSLRTWVEIDLDALECNFDAVREALPENIKILAVVKANAYGHGAIGVAKFLEDKADYLAVAATDEALELRKNGVNCPILILGHIPYGDYDNIVKNNITPTISDFYEAELLSKVAVKAGVTAPLHIAVDTGMNRIGFKCDDCSVEEIKKIKTLPNIEIEGVFSHLAAADMLDKAYTKMQAEKFDAFVLKLEKEGVTAPIKHLYNSAAIADLEKNYDMVRQGIILYGLKPSDEVEFNNIAVPKPVMSMKTRVVQVKTLPAGESISYGCTYTTEKETRVATLCAGYADGVTRVLSNNGEVLIRGKRAEIIGKVCMDQFMVDVTHIPEVEAGDTATIFGTDGNETISVDEIAKKANTINYEIICNINSRVTRVYMKNGKVESAFGYLLS